MKSIFFVLALCSLFSCMERKFENDNNRYTTPPEIGKLVVDQPNQRRNIYQQNKNFQEIKEKKSVEKKRKFVSKGKDKHPEEVEKSNEGSLFILKDALFKYNSYEVGEKTLPLIKIIANIINGSSFKGKYICIDEHNYSFGNHSRAREVAAVLVKFGVSKERIMIRELWKDDPIYMKGDINVKKDKKGRVLFPTKISCREANSRVEISLRNSMQAESNKGYVNFTERKETMNSFENDLQMKRDDIEVAEAVVEIEFEKKILVIQSVGSQLFADKAGERITQIIDVRTLEEYVGGRIYDAINISIAEPEIFIAGIEELNKNAPIAVYSQTGVRSLEAAKLLEESGFSIIYNLEKGVDQWLKDGKKLEK